MVLEEMYLVGCEKKKEYKIKMSKQMTLDKERRKNIESIVQSAVRKYAEHFCGKHLKNKKNLKGPIKEKKNNVFLKQLPEEFVYYSALVRSFDSSFGDFLEKMALDIAKLSFKTTQEVKGNLYQRQEDAISDLLINYKKRKLVPSVEDYQRLTFIASTPLPYTHRSDHILIDEGKKEIAIIELKAGGDLDNKKALAEKRALLEQYFIFKNAKEYEKYKLSIFFATAYNKYGEGANWVQGNVERFFANDELLIGKDFWNFICKSPEGFAVVMETYNKNTKHIGDALQSLKEAFANV